MPFFHVFGLVGTLILPTVMAAPTIPVPRYSPHDMLELIKKHRPTFFVGAPSIYISLMQQKDIANYDLTCIQLCISGSSPFPQASMTQFQNLTHAHITEGFGLTEASPVVIANPLYGLQKIGSIGIPIPCTEVRIVDLETGCNPLGDNEIGELVVRGPQVMAGYWNHPEETAAAITDGWLHTGDIAYRDSDGYYFIVDRKKDMAIVGGYNVFPREIDEVLHEYPKIKEAVSLSIPHKSRGETLKAYIVPKDGEKITVAEIAAFCRTKLASYKVPRIFEFRDELPKSMVGKVLRRALREEEEKKQKKSEE
jgi:long-chain acyl-CoA synthetase